MDLLSYFVFFMFFLRADGHLISSSTIHVLFFTVSFAEFLKYFPSHKSMGYFFTFSTQKFKNFLFIYGFSATPFILVEAPFDQAQNSIPIGQVMSYWNFLRPN